jgi:hypothetical protein
MSRPGAVIFDPSVADYRATSPRFAQGGRMQETGLSSAG